MGFQYRNSFLIEIKRKVGSTCVDVPVCPLVVKEEHIPFELMRLLAELKLDFKPFWQLHQNEFSNVCEYILCHRTLYPILNFRGVPFHDSGGSAGLVGVAPASLGFSRSFIA